MTIKEANEFLKKKLYCYSNNFSDCSKITCSHCDHYVKQKDLFNAMVVVTNYLTKTFEKENKTSPCDSCPWTDKNCDTCSFF